MNVELAMKLRLELMNILTTPTETGLPNLSKSQRHWSIFAMLGVITLRAIAVFQVASKATERARVGV